MAPRGSMASISWKRPRVATACSSAAASSARVVTRLPSPPIERRDVREAPVVEVVERRFGLERAQHLPAGIVEQDDHRVDAEPAAVAQLPAGHLEGAVADQDQRPPAGRELCAHAGRHAVAHAGIVAGCGEVGVGDLHGGEQAVADVGRDRHRSVAVEQVVDAAGDVVGRDRLPGRPRARADRRAAAPVAHAPGAGARASSASTRAASGMSR